MLIIGVIGVQSMQKQTVESVDCSLCPFNRRDYREGEVCGMLIMGVVGMLCGQKHVVLLAECSLEHWWLSIQQNATSVYSKQSKLSAAFW